MCLKIIAVSRRADSLTDRVAYTMTEVVPAKEFLTAKLMVRAATTGEVFAVVPEQRHPVVWALETSQVDRSQ
jgi:hypothetical protein